MNGTPATRAFGARLRGLRPCPDAGASGSFTIFLSAGTPPVAEGVGLPEPDDSRPASGRRGFRPGRSAPGRGTYLMASGDRSGPNGLESHQRQAGSAYPTLAGTPAMAVLGLP
jgi:hypothetical protein